MLTFKSVDTYKGAAFRRIIVNIIKDYSGTASF